MNKWKIIKMEMIKIILYGEKLKVGLHKHLSNHYK